MKPLLTQLWPQFTADADFMASFGSAVVERVAADRKKMTVTVIFRTANYVPTEVRGRLAASLGPLFPGFALQLQGLFSYTCLTPEAVLALARERGCYNVTLNVWACNQTAMDFYRRCGLQVQKTGMEVIL